jgi:hypothetical protein
MHRPEFVCAILLSSALKADKQLPFTKFPISSFFYDETVSFGNRNRDAY